MKVINWYNIEMQLLRLFIYWCWLLPPICIYSSNISLCNLFEYVSKVQRYVCRQILNIVVCDKRFCMKPLYLHFHTQKKIVLLDLLQKRLQIWQLLKSEINIFVEWLNLYKYLSIYLSIYIWKLFTINISK